MSFPDQLRPLVDRVGGPTPVIKLIKTPEDHAEALRRIEALMAADPAPGTAAMNELEVLAHLAETYEKARFPTVSHRVIENS
jgi:antitoxin component HigA of HigAB toxin-antitoxin module